jgi:hypothetical protein
MQTSYSGAMPIGKVGGISHEMNHDIVTRIAPAASEMPFGRFCVVNAAAASQGDGTAVCKLPDAAGDITTAGNKTGGVVVASQAHGSEDITEPAYAAKELVPVMRRGRIWVYTEDSVAIGSPVYVRHAANAGLNKLGSFAGATGTGLALLPGAHFATAAVAGALAAVELNLGGV